PVAQALHGMFAGLQHRHVTTIASDLREDLPAMLRRPCELLWRGGREKAHEVDGVLESFPVDLRVRDKIDPLGNGLSSNGLLVGNGRVGDPLLGDVGSCDELVERRNERLAPESAEPPRSEEHTSELQSRFDLVCRLLLEKK